MTWGAIGGAAISVVGGKLLGGGGGGGGGKAPAAADPFASQRPMYQDILGSLYGGMAPGGYTPSYAGTSPSGSGWRNRRGFKGSHPVGGGEDYGGTSHIFSGGLGGGTIFGSLASQLRKNGSGGMLGRGLVGLGRTMGSFASDVAGAIRPTLGESPQMAFLRNNPAYQFTLGETMRGTERAAAARGMNYSGNLMTALQDRASGLASQTYNTEVDRIMRMAGVGAGSPGAAGELSYRQGQDAYARNQQLAGTLGYGAGKAIDYFSNQPPSFPSTAEDYYSNPGEFDWGD